MGDDDARQEDDVVRIGGKLGRRVAGDVVAGHADVAGIEDRLRLVAGLGAGLVERRQCRRRVSTRTGVPATQLSLAVSMT